MSSFSPSSPTLDEPQLLINADQSSSQSRYHFTESQDWFSHNIPHWTSLLPLVTSPHPRVLEIGSWEGRSAVWLLTHLFKDTSNTGDGNAKHGGEIVCIDHFDLFRTDAGKTRFELINRNLQATGKPFRVLSQFSVPALMRLLEEEILLEMSTSTSVRSQGFDWIYIDGSHEADDTLLDAELAWRLARKDAVVIFDDYHWNQEPEESMHHPKRGIDAFLELHRGEYECLTELGHYQVVVRKRSEMRIGFLVDFGEKERSVDVDPDLMSMQIHKAFGYGMHIALAVDSAYAMPAAVVILSTVEHTPGRITFYIIDCGLADEDQQRLRASISITGSERDGTLTKNLGVVWAKLDMVEVLPVERVLYLDADILVRDDLQELWNTDLQGLLIAAAPDVGHPMGHDEIQKIPYFNAGVLLMDLAKIRSGLGIARLREMGQEMKDSKFRDQDALNAIFDNWKELSLKWNAQGLGTYARYPSTERALLQLDSMMDPGIVHFTGPVNPSLEEVLNLYVQPPTAKPWGYLGAPGHPFQDEWWDVCERTSWKGVRSLNSRKESMEEEVERAVSHATAQFRKAVAKSLTK
ncbi:glycosyl transferase [Gymnopus androsaceus JB14]|uniref:Glycosyl transferase n=1 Tax=Gymnopus androsaceus JB14 TaxID=1447944 RepID=A0A6A4HJK1_9AGAR|nr:glycosyl transferase [Gymnopus androsaceus JB14]